MSQRKISTKVIDKPSKEIKKKVEEVKIDLPALVDDDELIISDEPAVVKGAEGVEEGVGEGVEEGVEGFEEGMGKGVEEVKEETILPPKEAEPTMVPPTAPTAPKKTTVRPSKTTKKLTPKSSSVKLSGGLYHVKGDLVYLFMKYPQYFEYMVHQTNTNSKTVAGIASDIFSRYPSANIYSGKVPHLSRGNIGEAVIVRVSGGDVERRGQEGDGQGQEQEQFVVNLNGQINAGKPTKAGDKLSDRETFFKRGLDDFLQKVNDRRDLDGKQIAPRGIGFPYRIGSGLACGKWNFYYEQIKQLSMKFPDTPVFIVKLGNEEEGTSIRGEKYIPFNELLKEPVKAQVKSKMGTGTRTVRQEGMEGEMKREEGMEGEMKREEGMEGEMKREEGMEGEMKREEGIEGMEGKEYTDIAREELDAEKDKEMSETENARLSEKEAVHSDIYPPIVRSVLSRIQTQLETARDTTLGLKTPLMNINPMAYGYMTGQDTEMETRGADVRDIRAGIYLKSVISRKVVLHIREVGSNVAYILTQKLKAMLEGKCAKEGYIRPNSVVLMKHSAGKLMMGGIGGAGGASLVEFQCLFECLICNPVAGMRFMGTVIHKTKAGLVVRAATGRNANIDVPITAFISRDHHYNNDRFVRIEEGTRLLVRVLKSHFELGDKNVYVIGLIDDYGALEKERKTREQMQKLRTELADGRIMRIDRTTQEGRAQLREMARTEKGVTAKYAAVWLFMKNVEYMAGVLVSAWSWKMSGSKADTVVMITPDIAERKELVEDLKRVVDRVVVVDYISVKSRLRPEIHDKYGTWYADGYTKWACLQLAEYEKVLLVDADTVILNCMDDLFENVAAPAGTFSSPWLAPYNTISRKENPFYEYEQHGMEIPRDVMERGKRTNFLIGTSVLLEPSQEAYDRFILWLGSEAQREDKEGVVGFGYSECGSMLDEQAISLFYHDAGQTWHYIDQKYNAIPWMLEWSLKLNVRAGQSLRQLMGVIPEERRPRIIHYFNKKPWSADMGRGTYKDLEPWWQMVEMMLGQEKNKMLRTYYDLRNSRLYVRDMGDMGDVGDVRNKKCYLCSGVGGTDAGHNVFRKMEMTARVMENEEEMVGIYATVNTLECPNVAMTEGNICVRAEMGEYVLNRAEVEKLKQDEERMGEEEAIGREGREGEEDETLAQAQERRQIEAEKRIQEEEKMGVGVGVAGAEAVEEESKEETNESSASIQLGGSKTNKTKSVLQLQKDMKDIREWLRGNEDETVPSGWDTVLSMVRNNELHILGKGHYGRIYLVCVDMNSGQVMEADDAIVFMKERKDRLKNGTGTDGVGTDETGMDVLCFALKETKQAYQGNKRKSAEVDIVDAIIAYRDNHSGADLDEAHGIMYFADTRRDEEYERDYIAMEIVSKSISHEMKKIMEFSGYGGRREMKTGMKGGNDASIQLSMLWNKWMRDVYKTLDILHTKLGIYHLDVNVHNIMLRRRMEITDDTARDYDVVLGDFGHAEFKQKLLSTEIWGTEGVRMVKEDEDRKLIKMLLEGENAEKWILFDAVGSMDEIPRVESFLERNGLLGKIHTDLEKNGETLKRISRTTYKEVLFREIWNAGLYEKALKSMNKVNYLGFLKA